MQLDLLEIPGGSFLWSLGPHHEVSVRSFLMSRYPVTQEQWRSVAELPQVIRPLDPDPSNFKGDNLPVETVSWFDAMEFCDRLAALAGKPYRLPTEAEWEYACRAGTTTPFCFGKTLTTDDANFNGASKGEKFLKRTTPVGAYPPNRFGLHDMHGNVWEWCQDYWTPKPGELSKPLCGGAWSYGQQYCESSRRNYLNSAWASDSVGFRVACSP